MSRIRKAGNQWNDGGCAGKVRETFLPYCMEFARIFRNDNEIVANRYVKRT